MRTLTQKALILALVSIISLPLCAKDRGDRKQRPDIADGSYKGQVTLGANVTYEGMAVVHSGSAKGRFAPSISSEFRLTPHSGIGIGVGYRIHTGINMAFNDPYYMERYISIPITYKYYGRVMNFIAGVNYDQIISSNRGYSPIGHFGVVVGISKDIRLSNHFILEPSLMINPSTAGGIWGGIGLGVKYRL